MALSWRERLERLGPVRTSSRVPCGSPAVLALGLADAPAVLRSMDVTLAPARRGMSMLAAKRAIEAVMAQGSAAIDVPMVEDLAALLADLRAAGLDAALGDLAQERNRMAAPTAG